MPANKKYLTTSPWQRFAKLSCGILGGYILSALIHINLSYLFVNKPPFLSVTLNTVFILWVGFICIPYLFKNGWKAWLYYLIAILGLALLYFFVFKNS